MKQQFQQQQQQYNNINNNIYHDNVMPYQQQQYHFQQQQHYHQPNMTLDCVIQSNIKSQLSPTDPRIKDAQEYCYFAIAALKV